MAVGFEDCLDFGEHALTQLLEFWAAVIDGRLVHRAQDAIRHRRRTRNLQEMPPGDPGRVAGHIRARNCLGYMGFVSHVRLL